MTTENPLFSIGPQPLQPVLDVRHDLHRHTATHSFPPGSGGERRRSEGCSIGQGEPR